MMIPLARQVILLLVIPTLLLGPVSFAVGGGRATDAESSSAVGDNDQAIQNAIRSGRQVRVVVQLTEPSLATYTGGIRGIGATKPAKGKKLDRTSSDALGYLRFLAERRTAFKAYLRSAAPSAIVEREYDTVLNGLAVRVSGRELSRILTAPGVKAVSISRRFKPVMNISRGLIGTPSIDADIAALPGSPEPGEGIKIGIIDTGIERDHPFFKPEGLKAPPAPEFPKSDNISNLLQCTSDKIIVAKSYPEPGGADSCVDTIGHGTHVAGTAAGTEIGQKAEVSGVKIASLSGIAHRAWLANYNVFPNFQESAEDPEIIAAVEEAVTDGMDVLNMSLGGSVIGPETVDPLAQAVNAAAAANVVVAVAAGNDGPGLYTVASPGIASGALTAAASTNPHFLGIPVTFDNTTIPAAIGEFGNFVPAVTAPLANWNNTPASAVISDATRACSAIAAGTHTGQIVVIDRGFCTFTTKVRNAQNAGAVAVLIVNNVDGDPVAMGQDGTTPVPTIPAAMVSLANRGTLRTAAAAIPDVAATVNGAEAAYSGPTSPDLSPGGALPNADIIAGFSSRGPVPFDNRLKPDLSGPGVNVLSATVDPATAGFDWAFFQGTSMATPHLAGAAALLKQLHPLWTPGQIKSALVTRAKRPVFGTNSPLARGGGRVNLAASKDANATFSPSSFSFGQVKPLGKAQTVTVTITLTNVGSTSIIWTITAVKVSVPLSVCGSISVVDSVVGSTPSISPGDSFTFDVTATVPGGERPRFCVGDVEVSGDGQLHRLPFVLVHQKNVAVP